MKVKNFFIKYYIELIVLLLGITFGFFLMFSTFSEQGNTLQIASKAWSDFASHIPLIRSFSLGDNFPPQSPLFSGETIKYHFLFYYLVGILEKIGLRVDLALNIPSFLGFLGLVLLIFFSAKLIFKSKAVGLFSVIFFLFNSSFSFVYFFKNHPLSIDSLAKIPAITDFQSFAPYGPGIVSAFWNLNIYTNQRHLALSFALSLFIIYLIVKPIFGKKQLNIKAHAILGIVLGLSFFLHMAVFLMTGIVVLFLAITSSKIKKNSLILLIVAGIIFLPQYLYLNQVPGFSTKIVLGYLTANNFTLNKFLEFWIYNFGLSLLLIPLGFIRSNKNQRKILLSFLTLFAIGNAVQFSPEIAANHKFFNYFLLVGNMFSAYFLVSLWKKKMILKPIVIVLFFLMVFGGIIDFFPIYNDRKIGLRDYKINQDALWIKNNTKPNSTFLNTTFLYNPASLAGRKIFLGWPYFSWSEGYDTNKRGGLMANMLGTTNLQTTCKLLKENKIDYIEIKIQNPPDSNIPPISDLFKKTFFPIYTNILSSYTIYDVKKSCQ